MKSRDCETPNCTIFSTLLCLQFCIKSNFENEVMRGKGKAELPQCLNTMVLSHISGKEVKFRDKQSASCSGHFTAKTNEPSKKKKK
jgi:hypothetical protein